MRSLRLQLVMVLILAVLLPAIPAALTANALFRLSLDPLLEDLIVDGARSGLASTRDVLTHHKQRFAARLLEAVPVDTLDAHELAALDPRERAALDTWMRSAPERRPDEPAAIELIIPPERLPLGGQDRLVALVGASGQQHWVTEPVSSALVARAFKLTESLRTVETLKRQRSSVTRSLVSTFLVVYGIIVVLVLASGLLLASRITRPLELLGRGIGAVAGGDLATRVPVRRGGGMQRLLAHFNDMVEELGHQRSELVRLEKLAAWRQMARRLAHEIKNPLTPIQLAAQEIRDQVDARNGGGIAAGGAAGGAGSVASDRGIDHDADLRALVHEGTSIIEEEVASLRRLVHEFAQFSRMPEPVVREVEVAALLEDVTALFGAEQLTTHLEPGTPSSVRCDRDQMHRALINLVQNALDAQTGVGAGDPVLIEVGARRGHDTRLFIRILDRGPGVSPEDRQRIFEPDVTTKSDGMGLGLAIVWNTIQAHAGTITVGERNGGGACFTIELPSGSGTDATPAPGDTATTQQALDDIDRGGTR